MRPWSKIAIGLAAVAVLATAGYAELVLDWRTARSDLLRSRALTTGISVSLIPYNKLLAEMEKKYGGRANTKFDFSAGRITVELDGKIILEREQRPKFENVVGLFAVGPKGALQTPFPFRIAPDQDPSRVEHKLAAFLKKRFGLFTASAGQRSFSDDDWTIDRCDSLPAGLGFGRLGGWLRLRNGSACVVTTQSIPPRSMLISVSLADGDPWMRPFSRRLCRTITASALERIDPTHRYTPNYAACVLVDRPTRRGARRCLTSHVASPATSMSLGPTGGWR